MSKAVHSPLGQWRGRTGGQVYRVSHGQQIVSAYQPKVSNPKTDNQQRQRAKFNLMAKLNSITPTVLLRPFSPTPGIARPMFSKSLMKYIEVTDMESTVDQTVYTAKIAAADLHFGEGATLIPTGIDLSSAISVSSAATGVLIDIDNPNIFSGDVLAVRVIDVCRTLGATSSYIDVRYHDFNDAGSYTFQGTEMQHRIYVQFIVRRGASTNLTTGQISDEGQDSSDVIADSTQLVNSSSVVGSSVYMTSLYISAA